MAGAPEPETDVEITPEMVAAGKRFLENEGVSTEYAYSEFVEEFLRSAINGGRARKSRANPEISAIKDRSDES